jgi:UPF0042 nucleotide-binding protein
VVIVSGLSGAGKTVALRALEDAGYFCIDNLPISLIEPFLTAVGSEGDSSGKIGIGIDVRGKESLANAYAIILSLSGRYRIEILFLEAEKEVMLRRYKETRRPHPIMSIAGVDSIEKAIEEEIAILFPMRDAADRILDTSGYSPHQLRHLLMTEYGSAESAGKILVSVMSFGYKYGLPLNTDMLLDVRFLPNPYFIPELKPMKGTDKPVSDFVLGRKETSEFMRHLLSMLDFLIPNYIKEGKSYFVIAIGCTGGRHRSPVIAEETAGYLRTRRDIKLSVIHRDIDN